MQAQDLYVHPIANLANSGTWVMAALTSNKLWLIRQLVSGRANPYALWKRGAPCSDQQIVNDLLTLEELGIVHGTRDKTAHRGRRRGRSYWLDRTVIDLLPSSPDSPQIEAGLRILAEGVRIRENRRVNLKTAFALALMNHLVVSGKPYALKGSIKTELQSTVSTLASALESVDEGVPLWFLPFKTEQSAEQLAMVKAWADKSSPEVRRRLLGMFKGIEDPQVKESGNR
jgi:hypothetical protein